MSENCIFCKIIAGEIPSSKVYEDDMVYAFKDIHPEAPVHVLIVPKRHVSGVSELTAAAEDMALIGAIHLAAVKIAAELGIDKTGYRLLTNCGADAGQTVFHLHYHLLGGKFLGTKLAI